MMIPGVLVLGFLRARTTTASIGASGECKDNPDFLDAMGYPCDAWSGFDCSTASETFGYIFKEEDEQALLLNCEKTCELCKATTTTTTTTTAAAVVTSTTTTTTTSTTSTTTTTTTSTTTTVAGQFAVDKGRGADPATGTRGRHMRQPVVGMRVVRGPKWTNENQDGGIGIVGTVLEVDDLANRVLVKWPQRDEPVWYELGRSQIAESQPKDHIHFEELTASNAVLGGRVRRGTNWRGGDEDGGQPGEIVKIDGNDVEVAWPNGNTKAYTLDANELSIKALAAQSATEDLLESVWQEELDNARAVIASEEDIIASAVERIKGATDEAKAGAEREIEAANRVIKEADKVVALSESHLDEVAGIADAYGGGAVEGAGAVNATAQRLITNCKEHIGELEHILDELRQPAGSRFAVQAVPVEGNPIHLPLAPLDSFGSDRGHFELNKFGTTADARFNRTPAAPEHDGGFEAEGMKYRAPFNGDEGGFGEGAAGNATAKLLVHQSNVTAATPRLLKYDAHAPSLAQRAAVLAACRT